MRSFIQENYSQLLLYRNEGLQKVGARFVDELERPKSRCFYPTIWNASCNSPHPSVSVGPWRIGAVGPSMILAYEAVAKKLPMRILDVGCAQGRFRDFLELRRPGHVSEYVGIDVSPFDVDFPVFRSIGDIPRGEFDLILMSEVAEHMPADTFAEEYLRQFPRLMKEDGVLVVSVPNPLAPAILHRDVTHIQHYPWFDLYAMLRFYFGDVDVIRTRFISSPRRLFCLPMRRILSYFLEVDWCEGLTLVARGPKQSKATLNS